MGRRKGHRAGSWDVGACGKAWTQGSRTNPGPCPLLSLGSVMTMVTLHMRSPGGLGLGLDGHQQVLFSSVSVVGTSRKIESEAGPSGGLSSRKISQACPGVTGRPKVGSRVGARRLSA